MFSQLKSIGLAVGIAVLVGNSIALAADAEVNELRSQIDSLNKKLELYKERLDKIESSARDVQAAEPGKDEDKWYDKLEFGGDLRYRHEIIDEQGSDTRHRERIRARLGIEAQPQNDLKVGLRISSGSDLPGSTDQTLDGGFSSKSIYLDRAYFKYQPEVLNGVTVVGGKMATPWYRPGNEQLLWDTDLSPEGMAFQYSHPLQFSDFFANAGVMWVDERAAAADSLLYAGQLGVRRHITDTSAFTFGGSYFYYGKTKGAETFFDNANSCGNSVDAQGLYTQDYHLAEGFAQFDCQVGKLPVSLYGDYVKNLGADSSSAGDSGYLVGAAVTPGAWKISYCYRRLEKDATIGAFNDSTFAGGGTDGKGHKVGVAYKVSKNISVGATQFVNDKGIDNARDYNRTQLDFMVKF